uniref:Uncharacterized protein n=1 Tax=Ditylenchus dipsaci TaxID=166011 RepID=A0A915EPS4_9BILA
MLNLDLENDCMLQEVKKVESKSCGEKTAIALFVCSLLVIFIGIMFCQQRQPPKVGSNVDKLDSLIHSGALKVKRGGMTSSSSGATKNGQAAFKVVGQTNSKTILLTTSVNTWSTLKTGQATKEDQYLLRTGLGPFLILSDDQKRFLEFLEKEMNEIRIKCFESAVLTNRIKRSVSETPTHNSDFCQKWSNLKIGMELELKHWLETLDSMRSDSMHKITVALDEQAHPKLLFHMFNTWKFWARKDLNPSVPRSLVWNAPEAQEAFRQHEEGLLDFEGLRKKLSEVFGFSSGTFIDKTATNNLSDHLKKEETSKLNIRFNPMHEQIPSSGDSSRSNINLEGIRLAKQDLKDGKIFSPSTRQRASAGQFHVSLTYVAQPDAWTPLLVDFYATWLYRFIENDENLLHLRLQSSPGAKVIYLDDADDDIENLNPSLPGSKIDYLDDEDLPATELDDTEFQKVTEDEAESQSRPTKADFHGLEVTIVEDEDGKRIWVGDGQLPELYRPFHYRIDKRDGREYFQCLSCPSQNKRDKCSIVAVRKQNENYLFNDFSHSLFCLAGQLQLNVRELRFRTFIAPRSFYTSRFSKIFLEEKESLESSHQSFLEYISVVVIPQVGDGLLNYHKNDAEERITLRSGKSLLYALVTRLGQVIWIGICNDKVKSWVARRSQHATHFLRHSPHIYSVIPTQDAHVEDIKNGEYLTMISEDLNQRMIPTTAVNLLQLENNEYPSEQHLQHATDFLDQHRN